MRLHQMAYQLLRDKLDCHIIAQAKPILAETCRPLGGVNWNPQSELLNQHVDIGVGSHPAPTADIEEMIPECEQG